VVARGSEVLCGGESVVPEKISDLSINLGKVLNELSVFLGGRLEVRDWYLVRFGNTV
jgi:hypothetical protein